MIAGLTLAGAPQAARIPHGMHVDRRSISSVIMPTDGVDAAN
jgi:hypothetical protein